jgi:tetratricopeptide (TPR) repeat protein
MEDKRPLVVDSGMGARLIRLDPTELHERAGRIEEKDAQQAIRLYVFALQLDPTRSDIWVDLGVCYHKNGKINDAEECWMAAIQHHPRQTEALYNLAWIHREQGNLILAESLLGQVLEIEPGYADAHFNLAMVLESQGKLEQSLAHWKTYLSMSVSSDETEWRRQAERAVARLQKA